MLFLVLAAIFFAGIHLGVAGTTWRDRAVAVLGEGAYRAVFSIASLAGIIWLVMAYRHAPYGPDRPEAAILAKLENVPRMYSVRLTCSGAVE